MAQALDALYVALAQLLSLELWTDDRTLINALGSAAPWVRWIGDYPIPIVPVYSRVRSLLLVCSIPIGNHT